MNVGRTNYGQTWLNFSNATDTWDENNGNCSSGSYSTKSSCESRGHCSDTSYSSQSSCTAAGSCSISNKNSQSSCTSAGVCSDSDYGNRSSCESNGNCYKPNGSIQFGKTPRNCSYTWVVNTWTYGTWTYDTWVQNTWTPKNHSTWTGCVMDRDQSYDTTNTAPGSTAATLFPAEQYDYCPDQLSALSYDWTSLRSKISGLTAQGGTNQQIGLAWAFQTLTAAPFNIPAKDAAYSYNEVIILLSDGLNTQNRFSGNGSTYSSAVDDRQRNLCDNVKAAKITLYTVQVNTDNDPVSAVLRSCASDTGKFVMLTSADQIVSTFASIGTSLTGLRLTH